MARFDGRSRWSPVAAPESGSLRHRDGRRQVMLAGGARTSYASSGASVPLIGSPVT
jgi:hypothetical protein